jgi:hypothetical protein
MASIFQPTSFATALGPYQIDINDCIGDSVGIINANTNYLASYSAEVSSAANIQIVNSASTVITTLSTVPYARLNAGNQSGLPPIFGCRAWAVWAGISSNIPVPSFTGGNVSSIVRISSGTYRINFINPMPDENYAISIMSNVNLNRLDGLNKTNSFFQVDFFSGGGGNSYSASNPSYCAVMVIR